MTLHHTQVDVTLPNDPNWLYDMCVIQLAHAQLDSRDILQGELSERVFYAKTALEDHMNCTREVRITSRSGVDLRQGLQVEFFAYCETTKKVVLRIVDFDCNNTPRTFYDAFDSFTDTTLSYEDTGSVIVEYKPGKTVRGTALLAVDENIPILSRKEEAAYLINKLGTS